MAEMENIYNLLVEVSQKVGKIEGNIENIQKTVEEVNLNSVSKDKEISATLDEYFQYAKDRQDKIKSELEKKISDHETRIKAIETKKEKELVKWWDKLRDHIIWLALAALVGAGFSFLSSLVSQIKNIPPPAPIETTERK